ncbi:MAG: DUF4831 family protein [Odoribacter sp.]|nr:DUF4831 family protein [Odoribacter sp.]
MNLTMNAIRLFIGASVALAVNMSATAQTTQRLTASKANEYGLVYSLPVTEVDITIETEHTHRVPGEFFNYARRHLAISDAITAESTTVRIKSVTITPRGVADPANRWLVQFKSGSSTFIELSPEGTPLSINTDEEADCDAAELPVARPAAPTVLETEAARQAMTQDMIRSSSISKRAELAAQRVFELRDMRSDLLSGQYDNPPADGQAMQLVLQNIASQEDALTAMFAGTTSTWTCVQTFAVRPDSVDTPREVIARISPFDGILDADNLAGAPVSITVTVVERGELPVNEKGDVKKFPKGGVAYTIPGAARVSVEFEGNVVATADVSLAQLGTTFGLDPSLFSDKKAPQKLIFDPTTGAILQLGPAN